MYMWYRQKYLFYELFFVCSFIVYRLSFYDEYMINCQTVLSLRHSRTVRQKYRADNNYNKTEVIMNDSYIDDRKLHEECGVFGVYDFDGTDVATTYILRLFALQHRGQESCGIAGK